METYQLLEVIESGETQEIELKQSFHSSQVFAKLMSGFANTQGGMIIIGVNANKKIIGLTEDADKLQQKISVAAQTVAPPLIPDIQVHNIEGKEVIAVVIQKVIDSTFHTFQGAIYVKVGSTLKKLRAIS